MQVYICTKRIKSGAGAGLYVLRNRDDIMRLSKEQIIHGAESGEFAVQNLGITRYGELVFRHPYGRYPEYDENDMPVLNVTRNWELYGLIRDKALRVRKYFVGQGHEFACAMTTEEVRYALDAGQTILGASLGQRGEIELRNPDGQLVGVKTVAGASTLQSEPTDQVYIAPQGFMFSLVRVLKRRLASIGATDLTVFTHYLDNNTLVGGQNVLEFKVMNSAIHMPFKVNVVIDKGVRIDGTYGAVIKMWAGAGETTYSSAVVMGELEVPLYTKRNLRIGEELFDKFVRLLRAYLELEKAPHIVTP